MCAWICVHVCVHACVCACMHGSACCYRAGVLPCDQGVSAGWGASTEDGQECRQTDKQWAQGGSRPQCRVRGSNVSGAAYLHESVTEAGWSHLFHRGVIRVTQGCTSASPLDESGQLGTVRATIPGSEADPCITHHGGHTNGKYLCCKGCWWGLRWLHHPPPGLSWNQWSLLH